MPSKASEELYRTIQHWRGCFNHQVLGSYGPYTQIIELPGIKGDDLKRASELWAEHKSKGAAHFSQELYDITKRLQTLSVHEYTHFVDATSTVWGIELLTKLYSAFSIPPDESHFHIAKEADDKIRTIQMPAYYSTVDRHCKSTRPWRYLLTMGSVFDARGRPSSLQIPFLRFHNAADEFLARSPVSLLSMMEASATYQELLMHAAALKSLPADEALVENALLNSRIMDRLYDPELTEYSVCTHFVANWHGITDVFLAYRYTAMLTRFCLNIATSDIMDLRVTDEIARALHLSGSADGIRIAQLLNASLEAGDRAVLFSILARACTIKNRSDSGATFEEESRAILKDACKLLHKDIRQLEDASKAQFTAMHESLAQLETAPVQLVKACLHNFAIQDHIFSVNLPFARMQLPPALYEDLIARPAFIGKSEFFKDFDVWVHFDRISPRIDWIRQFSEACI